jgi:hypothetical protein
MNVSNILRLSDFALADFGLRYVRPARPDFFEPDTPIPKSSTPPVIAVVAASRGLAYKIDDRGITSLSGHTVYDFKLTPLRYPKHNVLHEIWIDTTTNLPIRYVAERWVEDYGGQNYSYPITVDAREIEGCLVNVDAFGPNPVRQWQMRWNVSDVAFPATEPEWVFDEEQWKPHEGEPIPNLAPSQPLR